MRLTLTHSKIPDREYARGRFRRLAQPSGDVWQYRAEGKVPPGFLGYLAADMTAFTTSATLSGVTKSC